VYNKVTILQGGTHTVRSTKIVAIATLGMAILLPTLAHAEAKLSGYVQERFTDIFGSSTVTDSSKITHFPGTSSFGIRRARIGVKGNLDAKGMANLELDLSKSLVELRKANIGYAVTPTLFATVGRMNLPFGNEIGNLSSSALTTLERSMISNTMPEYATGLSVLPLQTAVRNTKFTAGVFNGNDPAAIATVNTTTIKVDVDGDGDLDDVVVLKNNTLNNAGYDDPNNNKVGLLTVEHRLPGTRGLVGVSGVGDMDGHSAIGGYVSYNTGKIGMQSEYIANDFDAKLNLNKTTTGTVIRNTGYYVIGTYNLPQGSQGYVRYDVLDNNTIADKARTTVGFLRKLGDGTKVNFEYQTIDDPANTTLSGAFGAQVQVMFK
jgi:hypothetical protein